MSQMVELLLVFNFFSLLMADLSVTVEVVLYQAPLATVFKQEPQYQIPTAHLFILILLLKEQVYFGMLADFIVFSPFSGGRHHSSVIFTYNSNPIFLVHLAMSLGPRSEPESNSFLLNCLSLNGFLSPG
jgi:hypothetical protein